MADMAKRSTVLEWTLQIAVAAVFFATGMSKLTSDPDMVQMYDAIGIGQWFRYFTGVVEVLGATGLLVPGLPPFAAILLASTMLAAVWTHLFIIGGNPAVPIALFVALCAILRLRRSEIKRVW
jgi:putative oxidoreductase